MTPLRASVGIALAGLLVAGSARAVQAQSPDDLASGCLDAGGLALSKDTSANDVTPGVGYGEVCDVRSLEPT